MVHYTCTHLCNSAVELERLCWKFQLSKSKSSLHCLQLRSSLVGSSSSSSSTISNSAMSCLTGLNLDTAQVFRRWSRARLSAVWGRTNTRKKVEQQVWSTRDGQQFCKLQKSRNHWQNNRSLYDGWWIFWRNPCFWIIVSINLAWQALNWWPPLGDLPCSRASTVWRSSASVVAPFLGPLCLYGWCLVVNGGGEMWPRTSSETNWSFHCHHLPIISVVLRRRKPIGTNQFRRNTSCPTKSGAGQQQGQQPCDVRKAANQSCSQKGMKHETISIPSSKRT